VVEVQHPQTPDSVRGSIAGGLFTLPTSLTSGEQHKLAEVTRLMRGNATDHRHDTDARHLFEAAKYGAGYFITHDRRILSRAEAFDQILGPGFSVVNLIDFLNIQSSFAEE